MSKSNWHVYILRCRDNSLYTGITTDLERRLKEHKNKKGAKYTKSRLPVSLVYSEEVSGRSEASVREHEIKSLNKEQKEQLVNGVDR